MNLIVDTTKEQLRTPRNLNALNGKRIEKTAAIEKMDEREAEHERLIKLGQLQFYSIKDNYVKKDHVGVTITLQKLAFLDVLNYLGFTVYNFTDEKAVLVQVKDNIVEQVDQRRIIKAFRHYVATEIDEILYSPDDFEVPRKKLENKILDSLNTLFSDVMLYQLKTEDNFEFNTDTLTESFFYYQNGFVRVTKDKFELLPYTDLKKKIWRSQILQRDFKLIDKKVADFCKWGLFINYIAGNFAETIEVEGKKITRPKAPERASDFRRILGYMMHRYFEGKLRCIILTDSNDGDDDSGRSGKTLGLKGVGWMTNANKQSKSFVELDAKEFDPLSPFKWQLLEVNTQIIHINDVRKNFNLEFIYNAVLEGITAQKKNDKPFVIQSKMAISTNKTIKTNGPSAQDRVMEFQMSQYFNEKHSPQKEFGEWFGRDWDAERWYEFDNFMLQSISMYLAKGLPTISNFNLAQRKLKDETHSDFVEFMNDVAEDYVNGKKIIQKKEMLAHFKTMYNDHDKLTAQKFSMWLKAFRIHSDYDFDEKRNATKTDNELRFTKKEVKEAK